MDSNIVYVKCLAPKLGIADFFRELSKHEALRRDFLCARMDETALKDVIRNYVAKHGISSLFYFSITCDSVLHPGISVDEIEDVILGFIRKLKGVKNLYIIDPFFYADNPECLALFGRIVSEISENLTSVTFFTNGKYIKKKDKTHDILRQVVPNIEISDVVTDEFHDRYWIDPDLGNGVVMGTSLNGIAKKIALIDHLSHGDVKKIAELATVIQGAGE